MAENDTPAPVKEGLTQDDVAEWLTERYDNARWIAETKAGDDRRGWLEDAAYYHAATQFLARRSPAVSGEGERDRALIDYARTLVDGVDGVRGVIPPAYAGTFRAVLDRFAILAGKEQK